MIDLYLCGVGLTAMWMFADDFDRHTILALDLNIEPKYKLKDYFWRPWYSLILLLSFYSIA